MIKQQDTAATIQRGRSSNPEWNPRPKRMKRQQGWGGAAFGRPPHGYYGLIGSCPQDSFKGLQGGGDPLKIITERGGLRGNFLGF